MPSAQVTITQLPAAGPITGTESVPIVQNGQTVQTTTGAIAASPAQNQTFVTVNQEPTLANSRALSGGTGVTVVDNGAQSTLQINLTGAAASLDSSTDGLQSKNGATMVGRTITGSTGVSVTNGNGVSGNPTIGLDGTVGALAGLAGTGILGIVGGSSVTAMEIFGTAGEIDVANGTGPGNPTIGISDNPVMPGTGAMTLPNGTTAQRPGGSPGQMRYNTQTGEYEVYQGGSWVDISTSAGFVDVYNNGSLVGTQDGINFIPGNGMTYSIVNDPINNRVDVTQGIASSISLTTVNTTNLEVTNLKAKDGTAAGSVANATGIVTLNSSILTTTDINGGTIDGTTIGGSSAAAITGTTVTANTQFNGPGTGLTGTASGLSIGGNAATATSISAGLANQLMYQSAPSTTAFVTAPTVANTFLEWSGSAFQWSSNPLGTVTSVGLALPAEFTISNSPVTTTGTLTGAWASQTANYFLAAPNGSPGTPSFRAMVAADVPTLNQNTTGQAGSVANSATFTNTGGASAGATFNGSSPLIVDYSTVGAPKADGTGASGTWGIDITGNAGTSTSSTTATNLAGGAAGSIPYQTGSGTTTFLAQSSGVLVGGTTPSYSTAPSLTGTNFSSIPNSALQNSSITIGTTGISLGSSANALAGLTSVTVTQAPSSALQLATKQYVDDAVSAGLTIHTPVRVESPTALTASYTPGGTTPTITDISGNKTLTSTGHGLSVNDQIIFDTTSNGLTAGTTYYVFSTPTLDDFTLSLSYGGTQITTLTDGTGLTLTSRANPGVGAYLTNTGANAAIQIDGVTLSATNRVLVYNQANAAHNGIYTVTTVGDGSTPWVLTRATDADTYIPNSINGMSQGDYVFVQEGNTGAGESYVLTTSNPITPGTTNLTYTQFSAAQVYSAGTGLTLTGTTFSLTSPVVSTLGGTGLTSYTTGDLLYYSTGTALSKLGIGTSTYLLTSSGSAPQWSDPSGVTVGNATNAVNATNATTATTATTATNVAGGATGSLLYQSAASTTTSLALGTSSYILTAGGSAPQYTDPATITVGTATTATNANNVAVSATTTNATFYPTFVDTTTGNQAIEVGAGLTFNPSTNTLTTTTFSGALSGNATTATTATNIAGGTANQIPYQTGAGATSFVAAPSVSNTYLEWTGSAFQWSTVTAGVSSVTASAPLASSGGSTPDISLTGTVATGNGGTGLSSYTAGDLIYYATGTAFTKLGIGSSTYLLTSSGTAPQWSDPANVTIGTATNATNVAVTASSVNATFYPTFVDATTGNQAVEVDSDLTYNPSTNTLTAGTMTATTGIFGGTF